MIPVDCPDGQKVFVYKDISKAYPVYAKQYEVNFKASADSITKSLSKGNLDITAKNQLVKLRQDLDQERAAIQEQLKTAIIQLQTAPCDPENRRRMADLQENINKRITEINERVTKTLSLNAQERK